MSVAISRDKCIRRDALTARLLAESWFDLHVICKTLQDHVADAVPEVTI
jgi:hypothetical protein